MNNIKGKWALLLGASSGFGAATALELAKNGVDIFGVHMDRKSGLEKVDKLNRDIRGYGVDCHYYNINAGDAEERKRVVLDIKKILSANNNINPCIFLHSLAFGTLRDFFPNDQTKAMEKKHIEMTMDVMANSLVYWVQELYYEGLLVKGSRIFAMTSAGAKRVWKTYGAVSAAKASLEAYIRQIAFELASRGITANSIRAGATDTPALRKIPGCDYMLEGAQRKNPSARLTTPEDIAKVIALLSSESSGWMTGNIIGVEGGENIVE